MYGPLSDWRVIALFGGPGSGKGTQGKKLRQAFSAGFLEMGTFFRGVDNGASQDLFSCHIRQNVDLTRMRMGFYLPDEPVNAVFDHLLRQLNMTNPNKVLIIDGAGRTQRQVDFMADLLGKHGLPEESLTALCIDADMNCCRAQLHHRAQASGRADDDPAVIDNRIDTYAKHQATVMRAVEARMMRVCVPTVVPIDDSDEARDQAIARMYENVCEELFLKRGVVVPGSKAVGVAIDCRRAMATSGCVEEEHC